MRACLCSISPTAANISRTCATGGVGVAMRKNDGNGGGSDRVGGVHRGAGGNHEGVWGTDRTGADAPIGSAAEPAEPVARPATTGMAERVMGPATTGMPERVTRTGMAGRVAEPVVGPVPTVPTSNGATPTLRALRFGSVGIIASCCGCHRRRLWMVRPWARGPIEPKWFWKVPTAP